MRRVIQIFAVSLLILFSCQEQEDVKLKQIVHLRFEVGDSVVNVMNVEVVGESLRSRDLKEVSAIHSKTGTQVRAFVLIGKHSQARQEVGQWKIERTYVFTGECFEYGTLITGDNGVSHFTPANTITKSLGFHDVCPNQGEAFA